MSSTYSQKMSKIIADELGVSYQKTLTSFVKALNKVHPKSIQQASSEGTSANIPEHAWDWILTIEYMNRRCQELKTLYAAIEPSPKTLEKIVILLKDLYAFAEGLENDIDRSGGEASAQYMDAAVNLAASGQFNGWDAWMPPDYEELWLSFVRTGYADEVHADETDYHEISDSCDNSRNGSCRTSWMLNERGIKTFLIDGDEPSASFLELEKNAHQIESDAFD